MTKKINRRKICVYLSIIMIISLFTFVGTPTHAEEQSQTSGPFTFETEISDNQIILFIKLDTTSAANGFFTLVFDETENSKFTLDSAEGDANVTGGKNYQKKITFPGGKDNPTEKLTFSIKESVEDGEYSFTIRNMLYEGANNYESSTIPIKINRNGGIGSDTSSIPATEEVPYDVVWNYGGTVVAKDGGGYTVTPKEGYKVEKILVDGKEIEVTDQEAGAVYDLDVTASKPQRDVVIQFAYVLNFHNPAGGTLSVSRDNESLKSGSIVHAGETLTLTVTGEENYVPDSLKLTALLPDGETATDQNVYTITPDGEVTFYETKVTVTARNGELPCLEVTMKDKTISVTGLTLTGSTGRLLNVGSTDLLETVIQPDDATNKRIVWSSSDEDVATVEEGEVTALKQGSTTITATSEDGQFTVSVYYTVTEDDQNSKAAKIGTTEYDTLIDAADAAKDGDTIVLLRDQTIDELLILKNNCNLDLNGKTLLSPGFGEYGGKTMNSPAIIVIPNGENAGTIYNGSIINSRYRNDGRYQFWTVAILGELTAVKDCTLVGGVRINQYPGTYDDATQNFDETGAYKGIVSSVADCNITGQIYVAGELNLLSDSTIDGQIKCYGHGGTKISYYDPEYHVVTFGAYSGAVYRVKDCNVTNNKETVVVDYSGLVNIDSGTYHTTGDAWCINEDNGQIVIKGGRFLGKEGTYDSQTMKTTYKDGPAIYSATFAKNCRISEEPDEDGFYPVIYEIPSGRVTFQTTPTLSTVEVKDAEGNVIQPESTDETGKIYSLAKEQTYTYTVSANGYESKTGFVQLTSQDELAIPITLSQTSSGSDETDDTGVEGGSVITKGGTYRIKDPENCKSGTISVMTTQPVTLIGAGIDEEGQYSDLTIECSLAGAQLTIKDLWINDNVGQGTPPGQAVNPGDHLISFTGKGNTLTLAGTNLLETVEYVQGAGIHVGKGDSLTIDGDGTLYMYKYTQGSGIGGDANEASGEITFAGGKIFIKGSKTGAVIGGDAGTVNDPVSNDDITITGGEIVLINKARAAAIGSSAMGTCAGNVYLQGGNLTIISDYTGSAIGCGENGLGFSGDLYVTGGSFKAMRTGNSLYGNGDSSEHFVNDSLVTAAKHDGEGEDVALLLFDTKNLKKSASEFTVSSDQGYTYQGGLHDYYYTESVTSTVDNFGYRPEDTNLYFYLPMKDQTLTINGETVKAAWNEETQTFDLTYEESSDPGTTDTFGNVEITTGEHGTTTVSPEQAKAGDQVTITAKPDEGYAVDQITAVDANGKAIDVTDKGDGTYTFTMPAGKVNVNVTFAPIISIDAGTNGTATVDNTAPKTGDKVTVTVTPSDGYEVDAVTVTDKDGKALDVTVNEDGTYSFTKPEGNVSVKVTYKTADPDADCPSKKYSDLDISQWYHEAVDFVLNNKYFQGTSDTTFEPDGTMTRAMFVTVLSRLEGIDAAQYSGSDFTDVETGQWYTAAIQWASQNGIVLGVGEQQFDPNGEVTREQMAAIMYRYAQFKKIDTTKADASKFGTFSDKDSVSDWAVEAMTWATGVGIINGTDAGIEPQANSTRAQVAQIVKNYTEKVS